MECVKEKCPKYSRSYGCYNCNLDHSCSKFDLKECRVDEFFQELEMKYNQLKCLYNLISELQDNKL